MIYSCPVLNSYVILVSLKSALLQSQQGILRKACHPTKTVTQAYKSAVVLCWKSRNEKKRIGYKWNKIKHYNADLSKMFKFY